MFECDKCNMIFGSEKRLKIHYKVHENKKPKKQEAKKTKNRNA